MRNSFWASLAVTLLFASPALADVIQVNTIIYSTVNVDSPNDNYWVVYTTAGDILQGGLPLIRDFPIFDTPGLKVFLPSGSVINSATADLLLTNSFTGPGHFVVEHGLPPPDFNSPSVAPTASMTGSSSAYANVILVNGFVAEENGSFGQVLSIPLPDPTFCPEGAPEGFPCAQPPQVYLEPVNLEFDLNGFIFGSLATPGENWNGFIGGEGQVTIPFTVQVTVDYTPVPEPSTFALLGTGMMALVGACANRRKLP